MYHVSFFSYYYLPLISIINHGTYSMIGTQCIGKTCIKLILNYPFSPRNLYWSSRKLTWRALKYFIPIGIFNLKGIKMTIFLLMVLSYLIFKNSCEILSVENFLSWRISVQFHVVLQFCLAEWCLSFFSFFSL